MTKVGIFGANGRMGRNLIQATVEDDNALLSAAAVRESSPFLGIDAGLVAGIQEQNIKTSADLDQLAKDTTVWIDFTLPEALELNIKYCVANKLNLVVGVTGLTAEQEQQLVDASQHIAIVYAANFSTGVNLLYKLLEITAKTIGNDCDIEIIEGHHRFKKDAPSGTALALGKVIANTLDRDLDKVAVYGREGDTGERKRETIGFATVRAGDIVGEHTALFADIGERVEITHKASSRLTFAKGAVRAANWLTGKQNGLFDMQDVLGLKEVNL
ncbi:4-hydroxy-tetrahydrodipicolinate reductase [Psychrosphaera sp. B3R10]|uniref:4-hydroxy-tetrahydrodipicolinate reductase n=1 Tax=unclassified Psychrosphaera TaxID=2641570 RepID=UPI001C08D0F4|nr:MULTISPECIES: 4-hydroxy-tetrahydrodipicolinate reductase [unclassified Psychrosphaera]MBU2884129.1 4-hydroxy-tetrahydrodipicolinate reductase [Psychrosphaera sp. I2R16]MBU2989625.1 4-hydroxy-tetrahydrodipicolinate reductase [Psychrosphaera sp. B3R10]